MAIKNIQEVKIFDCLDIKMDDVSYMYNESLFPTFDMVNRDPDITGEPKLIFSNMEKYLDNFEFTQSWAFTCFLEFTIISHAEL